MSRLDGRIGRLEQQNTLGEITPADLALALLLNDPDARCNAADPRCKVMRDVAAFLADLERSQHHGP
jgi:hypothetical protein